MKIKILVAAHKDYPMPTDPIYLPIHVGKEGKEADLGFTGDNTGDHISYKNTNYCELTGIYWAYKNLEADYIGLVHYRRHFTLKNPFFLNDFQAKFDAVLSQTQIEPLLNQYDILLPKKRNYYIETNYSQYTHAHPKESLILLSEIIKKNYPSYEASYDIVMNRTYAHIFNMFVMRKDYFDQYCEWLFDVLFQLEDTLDISGYSPYDARVFGFLSERMLDIFIDANHLTYHELPVIFMERQNWLKKGSAFLSRKFHGKA